MKRIFPANHPVKLKKDLGFWFVILSAIGLLATIVCLYLSHGDLFSNIFFKDSLDTGMDFFHSIEYTRGRLPYEKFSTLYPPLANLFFYALFLLVPSWQFEQWPDTFSEGVAARGTITDMRIWQPTLFIFIIFIMTAVLCLFIILRKLTRQLETQNLIVLSFIYSCGILYALERGNIIIISLICCLFFSAYMQCKNKVICEIALIMLAIAAGLKIYPAIWGMLLIYRKLYKHALRAVLYGLALFFIPFLAFREKFDGIHIFLKTLFKFNESGNISASGFSFDKILNSFFLVCNKLFHIPLNDGIILSVGTVCNILITIIVLICGFLLKKFWQQALACCLAMILIQTQGTYAAAFFMIPLILMIVEERELSSKNIIPFVALALTQIMLPIWDGESNFIPLNSLRFQISTIILLIYILVISIRRIQRLHVKNK